MNEKKQFVASREAKGKAKQLRLFALLSWIVAIGLEIFAILKLIDDEMLGWLIGAIVVILALAITGNILWKKSNRLDPASEKEKVRFFVQNQLGAIIAVLAFLPLVLFIFLDKDASKKTKGVAGAIGIVALLIAGITGMDFNPPSVEQYTEQINAQTNVVKELNDGVDHVFWTPAGNKLHLYNDCQYVRGKDYGEGSVEDAWNSRGIGNNEVCKVCLARAQKEKGIELSEGAAEALEAAERKAK